MVAVQVLLMNYFLLGLHNNNQLSNDVIPPELVKEAGCPHGCARCTPVNGCLACKPPFFLLLHRDGASQTASCTRACPMGFFKLRRGKKRGFCAKCMLRGCSECTTRHYCSICKAGLVRHAGRCRKKCPFGTEISPRTPGLCLSSPTPPTDLDNEITKINRTWATTKTTTTTILPTSNGTTTSSLPTDRPPKRKRKKKRKKGRKNKKRHRRRKHKKNRLRNRQRKEMRRRRLREQRERRRKKLLTSNSTAITSTITTPTTTTITTTPLFN
ncbi:R-spondin-1-like [Portunus trituberculatus]|uniref:R-spondin-1-like n=1 Tax=Portunus trituberculatus TaxID=210409 RepID=UPI001E1CC12F|nr:R-spondin-1-like [Portunus trituberculatus]XP_045128110.1 R-spondin-1-like [Portunus trituberculatus]XP_045128118.1 R-spondin-1-like [Portunus trituberculatus]